jgi:hypothetical protein
MTCVAALPPVRLPAEIAIAGVAARAQPTATEAAAARFTLAPATIESAFPEGGRAVDTRQLLTTLAVTPRVLDALPASEGRPGDKSAAITMKNNLE